MSVLGDWIRHHRGLLGWFDCVVVVGCKQVGAGGSLQAVLAGFADGCSASLVLVERSDVADT